MHFFIIKIPLSYMLQILLHVLFFFLPSKLLVFSDTLNFFSECLYSKVSLFHFVPIMTHWSIYSYMSYMVFFLPLNQPWDLEQITNISSSQLLIKWGKWWLTYFKKAGYARWSLVPLLALGASELLYGIILYIILYF